MRVVISARDTAEEARVARVRAVIAAPGVSREGVECKAKLNITVVRRKARAKGGEACMKLLHLFGRAR